MDEVIKEAISKIAVEGADLTAIEESMKGYVKDPLATIDDKDKATEFIRSNPYLNSAYDSGISKGVEANRVKLEADNATALELKISEARQKIIAELNPEETPTDKRIRELEERLKEGEQKDKRRSLEAELISTFDKIKASDLGFKAEDVTLFADMGEKGIEQFVKLNDRLSEIVKARVDEAVKGKYVVDTPETGEEAKEYNFNKPLEGQAWLNT
ncbi:MAG: hypothetical protein GY787_22320 [Alteromonadales bacterium]|nr:hypothetical protein [Alteromonadales bacterium]